MTNIAEIATKLADHLDDRRVFTETGREGIGRRPYLILKARDISVDEHPNLVSKITNYLQGLELGSISSSYAPTEDEQKGNLKVEYRPLKKVPAGEVKRRPVGAPGVNYVQSTK